MQKQLPKFSVPVQFCWISLICSKYFVQDCSCCIYSKKVYLKRHFSACREILKLIFAFNHIKCARHNMYQRVYLNDLSIRKKSISKDFITNEYGTSSSGGFILHHPRGFDSSMLS